MVAEQDRSDANYEPLRENRDILRRYPVRVVEKAQLEGAVEGDRDQQSVGHHLHRPAAVDGVVQPVHGTGRF
ncbi:MAG: hypothetical protein ACXWH0_13890 [Acidimicrobiia bacterium]